jgi:hypothetical protein
MNEVPNAPFSQKLKDALTLTRLAQTTQSPEMLKQHLDAIERLLEYVLRNEENSGKTQA